MIPDTITKSVSQCYTIESRPEITIFTLSILVNGKMRQYKCESQRYIIDEIELLSYLSKKIDKKAPTEFRLTVLEIPSINNLETEYKIKVFYNNDSGVAIGTYYEIEKLLYELLKKFFTSHDEKLDVWL